MWILKLDQPHCGNKESPHCILGDSIDWYERLGRPLFDEEEE